MNTLRVAAAALLLCATPAWAINKCVGPDGRAVFQDAPCAGAGGAIEVKPASGMADPGAKMRAEVELGKARLQNAIGHGIATGQPVIGMTEDQLRQAMGAPARVNQANYEGTRKDQWVFHKRDGAWMVYTTNGIVRSMQFSPGEALAQAEPPRNCPTDLELRNLKVSANKIGATSVEIDTYRHALQASRDCDASQ